MRYSLLMSVILLVLVDVRAEKDKDGPQALQILAKVFRQIVRSQPDDLRIGEGVHLMRTNVGENDARASRGDDGTVLGAVESYLEGHELRIRLGELMPGEGFGREFRTAMDEVTGESDESTARGGGGGGSGFGGGGGGGGGGKKGGGGGGGIILVGLMMGKMLAALGLGGVGLLAMKALMVSAIALVLSLVVGLKKLVHSDHDEGGHHVVHAGHHEYRRKREAAEMAYSGWGQFNRS